MNHQEQRSLLISTTTEADISINSKLDEIKVARTTEDEIMPTPNPDANASSSNNNNDNNVLFMRKLAAVMGASGVAMGAFGAHALKGVLTKRGTAAMWQTATIYQLFHATAILSLAASSTQQSLHNVRDRRQQDKEQAATISKNNLLAGKLMAVGNLLFSGSIYCLALNVGPKKILGPITPIGGLLMIGGWFVVGMA